MHSTTTAPLTFPADTPAAARRILTLLLVTNPHLSALIITHQR